MMPCFMINNADSFSQPSLIIFTKGADIFGHDCMYIYIYIYVYTHTYTELGRLLTNCNPLLIPDYMTIIVVSNVIHYITHFR